MPRTPKRTEETPNGSIPDADRTDILVALMWPECHEGVSVAGEFQPCERTAVALRYDPEEGKPYPVCARHVRATMVPLGHIRAAVHLSVEATS